MIGGGGGGPPITWGGGGGPPITGGGGGGPPMIGGGGGGPPMFAVSVCTMSGNAPDVGGGGGGGDIRDLNEFLPILLPSSGVLGVATFSCILEISFLSTVIRCCSFSIDMFPAAKSDNSSIWVAFNLITESIHSAILARDSYFSDAI